MLVLQQRRSKNDGPDLLTYSKFPDIKFNCMSAGKKKALRGGAKTGKVNLFF